MRLGEDPHELGLRPVGVLELVDQDVPEAALDLPARGGRIAQETQGDRDLIPEIDEAFGRHQRLVACVGPGQLELPGSLLGGRRGQAAGSLGCRRTRGQFGQPRGRPDRLFGVHKVGDRADVLVLQAAEMTGQAAQETGRIAERAIDVQLELEQSLAQEDDDLRT